jgi:cytoskeleton protein RodZ
MEPIDPTPLTAGAWLRRQREAADISLETLSVALKVRPSRLQALESDQLTEMPDDLFVRTLALGICRHLKADEQALLPLLPPSPQRDLRVGRNQTHASPYNPNRWSGPMLFSPRRWPLKWLLGALVFAFLGMMGVFWPMAQDASQPTTAAPQPATHPEGEAGGLATAVVPTMGDEKPANSISPLVAPSLESPDTQGQSGKPHPLAENVVITPVSPMALQQNPPHLPTQPTKP